MRFFKTLNILLAVACFLLLSFRQDVSDFIGDLKNKLWSYTQNHPEEKVYVQFDKTLYKPGEDIWFNAFVLDGQTHKPTTTSDILHVELKDPKGNTVRSLTLFVQDGTTRGDFHLEESMTGGLYTVKAYTRWMQNAGEVTFFKKELQVQTVITPRMLLKPDFEKKAYGKGDKVVATLTVKDLKNEPIRQAKISATVRITGTTLLTQDFPTDDTGKAVVTFKLPDDLASTDGILQMVVSAAGQEESITRSIPIVLNKIALTFFPEGGDLIASVDNNVAFKATNEFGKGADIAGVILDNSDSVVASFSSYHMGMGTFRFTPQPGAAYRARIDRPAGDAQPFPLPTALSNGYSLMLTDRSTQSVAYSIHAPQDTDIFLVGQTHGIIYYAEKLRVRAGINKVTIPTHAFPAGIAVFTLFNGEGLEEAERLVFLNPQKSLRVAIETDKKVYAPREKVKVTIRTTDEHGKAVPAKLSLASVDDQLVSFADDKQDNILSWIFLSSELRGEIQEPSFYFDVREPKAFQAIDNLLLTHGWRRFTWKEVFQNDPAVAWLPENQSSISGYILDNHQRRTKAEVTLLELGERRRIAKVQTNKDGVFTYKNIDSSTPLLLLTRKPNRVVMDGKPTEDTTTPFTPSPPGENRIIAITSGYRAAQNVKNKNVRGDLSMEDDVNQLSEVVINAGYYSTTAALKTGSIATVTSQEIETQPFLSPLLALQGRMPGIEIQPSSGSPGSAAQIQIRGMNTLRIQDNQPLYVIDGVPIQPGLSPNFQLETLSPENIGSIEIMKDANATAIYGSRGASGVIIITTKSGYSWYNTPYPQLPGRYTSVTVEPRKFSVTREFYNTQPKPRKPHERRESPTTAYWNNMIITNQDGEATASFYNADATSAFRLTAEGITAEGLVGRSEQTYATQLPFSLDTKIPAYLGFEDTLRLPILVKNNLSEPLAAQCTITIPDGLKAVTPVTTIVNVPPGKTTTHYITIVPQGVPGTFPINIALQAGRQRDEITREIDVHPIGFQMHLSVSGRALQKDIRFDIRDVEKGSLKGEVTVYTDLIADLFSGAEGILAEPHGCFEQVSSSTFPNILALQFLQESGQLQPASEQRAMDYIVSGYSQLMAYEIDGGGFEWFGHPPAHEALTAYGLIEFTEMKKVSIKVNEEMLERTRKWILSRRKGDGTFLQNHGKYGFSSASSEVNNAYLVYALAETGTKDINLEYTTSLAEAWSSGDMYRMALMANTAYDLSRLVDYKKLIDRFRRDVASVGFDKLPANHSVVRSYGMSLTTETVALWTLALLKASDKDFGLIRQSIDYILSKRSYGKFGSTQATTLALKALTQYATLIRSTRQDGDVRITANTQTTDARAFTKSTREKLVLNKFVGALANGANQLSVCFQNTTEALPYAFDLTWNTKTPATHTECKVRLDTKLLQKTLKINETVRLVANLRNIQSEGLPMTVALIGIPAGLSIQPWQLKELQEKRIFDFYEVIGDKLAIYYRELGPLANHTINLDLKAEVSGNFTGTASCAYLYYTDEHKDWVKGNHVQIR